MLKKQAVLSCACVLLSALLVVGFGAAPVSGWSNGGYSGDPAHPGYGTHDWIAEHAVNWLPPQERQFFLDNLASFLYGTELPDNGTEPGGVGDTTKHHVYFFANGSLQDDVAAVRAREEYANATHFFSVGNFSEAAKRLGMVVHYIGDLAVFGHVMGSDTAWGTEVHHSSYESYVLSRTNNYTDDFNGFLVFDENLSVTSAYNAAVTLAHDTTFDGTGNLNCTWMDQHYNWSDSTFKNRCGESLNLAVNLIAEVLHSFYAEAIIPEFPSVVIMPLLMMAMLLVVFVYKRKHWG